MTNFFATEYKTDCKKKKKVIKLQSCWGNAQLIQGSSRGMKANVVIAFLYYIVLSTTTKEGCIVHTTFSYKVINRANAL